MQRLGELERLLAQIVLDLGTQAIGRQRASRIARVHTRLLYVLHDPADEHVFSVANGVDIDLYRHVEETVQQHRAVVGDLYGVGHVCPQIVFVENDLHRTAAEYVRGSHDERETDFAGETHGLVLGTRSSIRRLLQIQVPHERLEALPVLGDVDGIRRCADNRRTRLYQGARQFQRRLADELHVLSFRLFLRVVFQYVNESQWL